MYVGKGYLGDGMFKLNVIVTNAINKMNKSSVYIVDSFNIWLARLGHVNYRSLHRMVNLGLLPKFKIDLNHQCETCTKSKFARQSLKLLKKDQMNYLVYFIVIFMTISLHQHVVGKIIS